MQHFSSKILLFGEYSVVVGGNALAMPFAAYQGQFRFSNPNSSLLDTAKWSNRALLQFASAIEEMMMGQKLLLQMDVLHFMEDLRQGMFFDSNIPKGYGLGSSGAVVAGVVSRYGKASAEHLKKDALPILQQQFAVLESHFHGQSSGFDPLVCYLNQAVLKTKDGIQTLEVDLKQGEDAVLFLIDTHLSRETGPLVQHFLSRLEEPEFDLFCREELKPVNNACMDFFLKGNRKMLKESFEVLSALQWEHFQRMIPTQSKDFWERGLKSRQYVMKLCGAGGGGCLMGLADRKNWQEVERVFGSANLKEIGIV